MKRTKPILRRTPLRKVSKKRRAEKVRYTGTRMEFLAHHFACQVCDKARSTDVHHTEGRIGSLFLDQTKWLAVCRPCHIQIHNSPSWARANGYLK